MIPEYSDSTHSVTNSSRDESLKSSNSLQDEYVSEKFNSSLLHDDSFKYSKSLSQQRLSLYPSTSLNRELDGINTLAYRSLSSLHYSNTISDQLKNVSNYDEFGSQDINDNQLVDDPTSTPQNRLSDYSDNNRVSSSKLTFSDGLGSNNYCSTPVTKKSRTSLLDPSSNSPLRFNPASLISLPFGYNNNTFTKIKTEEIIYPTYYKKKLKIGDLKYDKKFKKGPFDPFGVESDYNDGQYMSDSPESSFKKQFISDLNNNPNKKSVYNLMAHNDYSNNPYKRRYQSVINERRRLIPLNDGFEESVDHVSLYERFPKKPRKHTPKPKLVELDDKQESSQQEELSDEAVYQKKAPPLPCYTLPSLHKEYQDYIAELNKRNTVLETELFKEMIETLTESIGFRQKLYKSIYDGSNLTDLKEDLKDNNKQFRLNDFNEETLNELNLYVKKTLNNVNNDLIVLNYMKGLLKCDYASLNMDNDYESHIDYVFDIKKLRRLFKHDLYSISYKYSNQEYMEDSEPVVDKTFLMTSPSLTFYNGLMCMNGECCTYSCLNKNNILTECDSSAGCYLWNLDNNNKYNNNNFKKEQNNNKENTNDSRSGMNEDMCTPTLKYDNNKKKQNNNNNNENNNNTNDSSMDLDSNKENNNNETNNSQYTSDNLDSNYNLESNMNIESNENEKSFENSYENENKYLSDNNGNKYLNGNNENNESYTYYASTGPWTQDEKLIYDVVDQNKRNQLKSTLEFIKDVCKVAIAEVRIPKPDWCEFTEYNCVNGYCCSKCCTCKRPTDHTKLYSTTYVHEPLEDKNINFSIDTKIATVDLLKNILGSCSCYCKCNSDGTHILDRIISEHTQNGDLSNEAISWYDVDTSGLMMDSNKRYSTDQIVQERFILRVKLDSLPLSWKLKVPFTCKLEINNENNNNNKDIKENNTKEKEKKEENKLNKETNTKDKENRNGLYKNKKEATTPTNLIGSNLMRNGNDNNSSYMSISQESIESNMDIETPVGRYNNYNNTNNNKDNSNNKNKNNKDIKTNHNNVNKEQNNNYVKNFKFINDFTFWDALELLKNEHDELHSNLLTNPNLGKSNMCFDPLEIDTSFVNRESIQLDYESFATDSKHDSYVEIALYLPYVPSNILPWEFDLVDCVDFIKYENNLDNENEYNKVQNNNNNNNNENNNENTNENTINSQNQIEMEVREMNEDRMDQMNNCNQLEYINNENKETQNENKQEKENKNEEKKEKKHKLNNNNKNNKDKVDVLKEYNLVTSSFKKVMWFMKVWVYKRNKFIWNEKIAYEDYKKIWHSYIRTINKRGVDLFSWGVLPVRAMDLPNKFIPLPAGYKHNDISYPYVNQGTTSPFDIQGYGIGDLVYKKTKFGQSDNKDDTSKNEISISGNTRHRDTQLTRKKIMDDSVTNKGSEQDSQSRSNTYLIPFFSNLTGPSVRWTHNLMDSLKEPINCIPDFKSLPIYKAVRCPEMNLYGLDNLMVYDRKNVVTEQQLLEDELNYRISQVWTKSEVRTFVEKYLMYPKNFSKIAQFLENKKCADCVEFYYRFKYRLKLKQGLYDLRSRAKAKFDMTRHLKREACIMNSLDTVLDDCTTEIVKNFNDRNSMSFNTVSDYSLRCGSIDSKQKYDMHYTQHYDWHLLSDDDNPKPLDNIAEGYFLPKKYLSMTTRKTVSFPATDLLDDGSAYNVKGCFLFDYSKNQYENSPIKTESEFAKSMIVSINSESFVNNRRRGSKRVSLSNVDKIINKIDEETYLFQPNISPADTLRDSGEQTGRMFYYNELKEDKSEKDDESANNDQQQSYQGMVTRKKILTHTRYGYDSPKLFRQVKHKTKKKASKWTNEEKNKYNELLSVYGKDWSRIYHGMSQYGKTMEQIKNYYHKNQVKIRNRFYRSI